MAFELFGFKIGKIEDEIKDAISIPSFVPKPNEDGAVEIAPGGSYGTYIDLESTAKSEIELVTKYRQMAQQPDIDLAIQDIINEAIINDKSNLPVTLNLDKLDQPARVKTKLTEEFQKVLALLDFQNMAHDIFQRWYVDGRIYYHMMIDSKKPREGIKELRYIDPRRMRKLRVPITNRNDATPNDKSAVVRPFQEYYLYNKSGHTNTGTVTQGVKISPDSICHVHSGLLDEKNSMVFSHLHKAMKPFNQLRMLEDATVIYRLARAPERRIFYIDVGNLPKMKAEQYLRDMMVKHKNRLVYDATTGEVRDDRKFMCLTMDTKVPLLDGRTLTLTELTEEYVNGKQNWVYSCDPVTGKFSPGPVSWAGITIKNSDVVKVTLDNGQIIICTPDHKFPVWNKGFIEAQHLENGESIIPGYRRKTEMYKGGGIYEQIYKNDTQTWEYTHREVAQWKDEQHIREEMVYNSKYVKETKHTVHHKNYKRADNSPLNLVRMHKFDHIENLSEFCRNKTLNRSNIKGKFGSRGYRAEQLRNHKVISVEHLNEKLDVGCLTVDLEETYHSNHTYLLDAGVYTKNTMLEDYWLPRREGNRGTEITTLPGGQNLGQLEDVEYFRKKLYQSLNVPISRMLSESTFNMGKSSEITRDEIKFTKLIARLRSRFSHMFDRILETQLVLTGVMSKAEWNEVKNYISYDFQEDNYYAELKEQEILSQRLNILQIADGYVGKYYSQDWIRRNILRLTEDDIRKLDDQIGTEQANAPPPEQSEQDGKKELPSPPAPIPQGEPPVPKDTKNITKEELELIQNMSKLIENVNNENEDNLQDDR